MNINIPTHTSADCTLEIPTTDNGREFKTLVPVGNGLAKVDAQGQYTLCESSTTLPVTVVGTTEETAKGLRRVLIKVSMPYVSVSEQANCCSDGTSLTTKVAGDMSLHTVLTLPRAAVSDVTKGGVSQAAVAARIALLQSLLSTLVRLGKAPASYDASAGFVTSDYSSPALIYGEGEKKQLAIATYNGDDSGFFNADSPYMRGANLLAPFVSTGSYGAPSRS